MKPYRNNIILLVFFLQLLMPLSFIAMTSTILAGGQTVTVRMAAYDPYDMIRGRYLQMRNPDSEAVPDSELEYGLAHRPGLSGKHPDLYVVLKADPDTGLSRYSFATLKRPFHGIPYIKCPSSDYSIREEADGIKLYIYPRIDRYYLNESDANSLDQNIRADSEIRVKLKLWNGMYAVDGIEVDGVPY